MRTIDDLQIEVAKFVRQREWNQWQTPKNLSMSIAIEAAELMQIFQWKTSEESLEICHSDEIEHVGEEIADVIIYCISMANELDLNVAEIISDKIAKNAIKYPVIEETINKEDSE